MLIQIGGPCAPTPVEMQEKIKKLEAENKILRETLEFYADKKSWQTNSGSRDLINAILNDDLEPYRPNFDIMIRELGGKRARAALAACKGEEK